MLLKSERISLRALEPKDIDLLYAWENDTSLWEVSHTQTPFSRRSLQEYVRVSHYDIYTTKQLRLIIQNEEETVVGLVDLFDFDPYHLRAGVGILVNKKYEGKGYASEALKTLKVYVKEILGLHQLYANIQQKNKRSLALFEKQGFTIVAIKKDWLKTPDSWEDEVLLQCLDL